MPLLDVHTSLDCQWGLWRTEETWTELLAGLTRRDAYRPFLDGVRSDGRRAEWLAVRALLRAMLGDPEPIVAYRPEGDPYLPDRPDLHVSFTHTRGYAAAICACTPAVGIDIERPTPRILRLRDRFLNTDELDLLGAAPSAGAPRSRPSKCSVCGRPTGCATCASLPSIPPSVCSASANTSRPAPTPSRSVAQSPLTMC